MQGLPVELPCARCRVDKGFTRPIRFDAALAAIGWVTDQRRTDMRQMHTDLVRAARLQTAFDQGCCRQANALVEFTESLFSLVVRHGVTPVFALFIANDGHFLAVAGGAGNAHVHRADQRARRAARDGEVSAVDIVRLEKL